MSLVKYVGKSEKTYIIQDRCRKIKITKFGF